MHFVCGLYKFIFSYNPTISPEPICDLSLPFQNQPFYIPLDIQSCVEGIDFEMIMVCAMSSGGHGPLSNSTKIVVSLPCTIGQFVHLFQILSYNSFRAFNWQIHNTSVRMYQPVHPGHHMMATVLAFAGCL